MVLIPFAKNYLPELSRIFRWCDQFEIATDINSLLIWWQISSRGEKGSKLLVKRVDRIENEDQGEINFQNKI